MHGTFLHAFKQFVVRRDGPTAWEAIVRAAGRLGWYEPAEVYADDELLEVAQATAAHEGREVASVLEEFGVELVPTLLSLYQEYLDPEWRTLDLLANAESVIHRTIRMRHPDARPPQLGPRRVSDHEVHIEYASKRHLCAVAMGICKGVAGYYREQVAVEQSSCMDQGAPACRIVVRLAT